MTYDDEKKGARSFVGLRLGCENEMPVKRRDKGFEGGDDRNEAALLSCSSDARLAGVYLCTAQRHSVTASHSFPREELAEKNGRTQDPTAGTGRFRRHCQCLMYHSEQCNIKRFPLEALRRTRIRFVVGYGFYI